MDFCTLREFRVQARLFCICIPLYYCITKHNVINWAGEAHLFLGTSGRTLARNFRFQLDSSFIFQRKCWDCVLLMVTAICIVRIPLFYPLLVHCSFHCSSRNNFLQWELFMFNFSPLMTWLRFKVSSLSKILFINA